MGANLHQAPSYWGQLEEDISNELTKRTFLKSLDSENTISLDRASVRGIINGALTLSGECRIRMGGEENA